MTSAVTAPAPQRPGIWALVLLLGLQAETAVWAQGSSLLSPQQPAHQAPKPQAATQLLSASNETIRLAHLAAARALLLAGDTDAATAKLDQAEGMSHSADTEVLQVLALITLLGVSLGLLGSLWATNRYLREVE